MHLSLQTHIIANKEQKSLLEQTLHEYVRTVNDLARQMITSGTVLKPSSKDVEAKLPSAVKNQAIRDAKTVFSKFQKKNIHSTLKKPVCIWNYQNYTLKDNILSFPVFADGKSTRIQVKLYLTAYQQELWSQAASKGTLRISKKGERYSAQISLQLEEATHPASPKVMGVDLGIKVPAVAVTEEGKTKFFGNGRRNKYLRRYYRSLRQQLGKAKQPKKIKANADKEQRFMKDEDHKVSRSIVNFAVAQGVSIIRLEQLQNIRQTTRTSRKNNKSLHNWSFYRLAQYIAYKAKWAGIQVEYVNPSYTSQTCPKCGTRNHAVDRRYRCKCGFATHRDRVGAMNIVHAPVADGVA